MRDAHLLFCYIAFSVVLLPSSEVLANGSHSGSPFYVEPSYQKYVSPQQKPVMGRDVPQYLMRPEARSSNFEDIDQIVERTQSEGKCQKIQEECSKGCRGDEIPLHALKGFAAAYSRAMCGRQLEKPSTLNADLQKDPLLKVLSSDKGQYAASVNGKPNEILNNKFSEPAARMGQENIAQTFAVIAALPAQEADYNILEGVDKAKTGEGHDVLFTQEAGMFQVSSNSQGFLMKDNLRESYLSMLDSYINGIKKASGNQIELERICMPAKFTENGTQNGKGVDINPSQELGKLQSAIAGINPGEKLSNENFIMFQKACPAFATEYMALLARVTDAHNGPLKRGDIKVAEGCQAMFVEIGDIIESKPALCQELGLSEGSSKLNF
jgi:hypothetical protein